MVPLQSDASTLITSRQNFGAEFAASFTERSLAQNEHLIAMMPEPQQLQEIYPSGEAPIKGCESEIRNPAVSTR